VRRRPQSELEKLLRNADPRPNGSIPNLPNDITGISDTELMDAMQIQTEWQNFLSVRLVELEQAEGNAESAYELAKAAAYLEGGESKSVTEGKSRAAADEGVKAAWDVWKQAKADRKVLEITRNNRERDAALLSRELSRRIGGAGVEQRTGRYKP
jgi:hypothetical protein